MILVLLIRAFSYEGRTRCDVDRRRMVMLWNRRRMMFYCWRRVVIGVQFWRVPAVIISNPPTLPKWNVAHV